MIYAAIALLSPQLRATWCARRAFTRAILIRFARYFHDIPQAAQYFTSPTRRKASPRKVAFLYGDDIFLLIDSIRRALMMLLRQPAIILPAFWQLICYLEHFCYMIYATYFVDTSPRRGHDISLSRDAGIYFAAAWRFRYWFRREMPIMRAWQHAVVAVRLHWPQNFAK